MRDTNKTIYIKKHTDEETGEEYILAEDIYEFLNEYTDKAQYLYQFLTYVQEEFNYFNTHSSTAFGNPDLERVSGIVFGWCLANKWQWEEEHTKDGTVVSIYRENKKDFTKHGRLIMKIDKPNVSEQEVENRKDIARTRAAFGL